MAIASVTQWLNGKSRNYHHGRTLYEQYGSDPVVLAIIRTGSGSYHLEKLVSGLEAVNREVNLEPKKITYAEPDPEQVPPAADTDGLPPELWQIRNEKTRRYALARKLFESIRFMDSADHRLEAALELLDHMDYVSDAWGAIDEYLETGRLRELKQKETAKAVHDYDLATLIQQDKNLQTYISKAKKRLGTLTDPRKVKRVSQRMCDQQLQLAEVRKRIKEISDAADRKD